MEEDIKNKGKECFDVSLRLRNLEIELFWKRSLFFWGFIASAFGGFISVKGNTVYTILLASFGCICSFCWTLMNRGSKRWQENWEQRTSEHSKEFIGELLKETTTLQNKGWFSAKEFSPSKLAILLSDCTCVFWLIILLTETISLIDSLKTITLSYREIIALIIVPITIILIVVLLKTKLVKTSRIDIVKNQDSSLE